MFSRALLIVSTTVPLAFGLSGCGLGAPKDLTLTSVRVVDIKNEKEFAPRNRPNTIRLSRPLFKVEFTSNTNLSQYALENGYNIRTDAYLCDADGLAIPDIGISLVSIYWRGVELAFSTTNPIDHTVDPPYVYYGYVPVEGILSRDGREKEKQFYDLRKNPSHVCFFVRGGKYFGTFKSNIFIIPQETLVEALKLTSPRP